MNIFVIDDDHFVLKLIRRQIENLGYADIAVYLRAGEAVAAIEAAVEPVELVFCDIQMPEMDGVELIRHLAEFGYQGGLVLMSGEDERILQTVHHLAESYGLRVLNALEKPVTQKQLQSILDQQLNYVAAERVPAKKTYRPEEFLHALRKGELVNYYQPKVAIRSGEIVGVETLVRWQHSRDGLVFPDQFIAMAEQHHLIDLMTRVVMTEAFKQSRRWCDAGLQLSVAVNISMDSLASLELLDFIVDTARQTDQNLENLVLEVTESQLMHNPLTVMEILTRLRLKSITLSIDDFGTGHSSLAQLRDIPFNELKVNAGFVHQADQNSSRRAILEASLDMARRMGIKTVAEGVENLEDWNFLADVAQCDLAQGYFIARPMPAADLIGWVQSWHSRRRDLVRYG